LGRGQELEGYHVALDTTIQMLSALDVDGAYFAVHRACDGSFKHVMLTDVQGGLDQGALFDAVLYLCRREMLKRERERERQRSENCVCRERSFLFSYFFVDDFVLVCFTVLGSHYNVQKFRHIFDTFHIILN
jgi:hypothetical protein